MKAYLPAPAERDKQPRPPSPHTYALSPRDNVGYSAAQQTGVEPSTTAKGKKSCQWSHPKVGTAGKSTSDIQRGKSWHNKA